MDERVVCLKDITNELSFSIKARERKSYSTQEGIVEIKDSPYIYTTQEGIEEI